MNRAVLHARELYAMFADGVIRHRSVCELCHRGAPCRTAAHWALYTDARSLNYDLAVARSCRPAAAPAWLAAQQGGA